MRYAVAFSLLGGWLIREAFRVPAWAGWLLGWSGVSCLAVAVAYAGAGPAVFGKRADGRVAWWSLFLVGPHLAGYRGLWHLVRLVGREPAADRVAPGVYLGRRPLGREVPPDVTRVVDLCVEFPAHRGLAAGRRYDALPTLDAGLAAVVPFRRLVADVAADESPVYVHCASGHGRGAMFAAALLIARGLAADVERAEAILRQARPGVKLSRPQREFVRRALAPRHNPT